MARVKPWARVGVASTVVVAAVVAAVVALAPGSAPPAPLANGLPACTTAGVTVRIVSISSSADTHVAPETILISNDRGRCDLVGAPGAVAVTGEDLRPYTAPLGTGSATPLTVLDAHATVEITANVPTCTTANPRHLAINETTGLEVRLGSAASMTFYDPLPIDLVCAGARIPVTPFADARPATVSSFEALFSAVPVSTLVRTR